MSTFSHSQDEERGKQPAREAPGEQGEVPRKRDDSKDDKSDPGIRRMADSVTLRHQRHENQGTWGPEAAKDAASASRTILLFDITTGGIKWRFIRKG